jgi:antitoxin component YwqK of YwqJK toxin-antitoxin module
MLFLSCSLQAQNKEVYYDADWKKCDVSKASFASFIKKTDSGWIMMDYYIANKQLQMSGHFSDEACKIRNGVSAWYHPNGYLSSYAHYINNKKEGACYSYHDNSMMRDSAFYKNGEVSDVYLSWHRNGVMRDSVKQLNDSTTVSISWFDNGTPSHAGILIGGFKNGRWKYYHNNGMLACTEAYQYGDLLNAAYFDESGKPDLNATGDSTQAEFKGGEEARQRKLYAKLYWPERYRLANTNVAVTVVDVYINENGKIIHVQPIVPFHPEFDKSVLNGIKNSGDWIPARAKNRRVPYVFRQRVSFKQED